MLHAPPFRLIGAGQYRWRVGEGPRGHGFRLAHRDLQQALGRCIAHIALAPGDMRHPVELFVGQPYVEIQAQRLGDSGHDRFSRPTPIGTANQLADQPTVRDGGIAMAFARCPPGCFGCQGVDHGLPVVEGFGGQQLAQGRQARLMAQQLAQGDGLLAGCGELRPITRYGRVQLQLALGDQLQDRHCRECLGAGKQIGDGVAVPGTAGVLVCSTGPQVQHGLPTDLHAQRSTALLPIIEQRGEGFAHGFELELVMALNLHPVTPRTIIFQIGGHCSSPGRFCEQARAGRSARLWVFIAPARPLPELPGAPARRRQPVQEGCQAPRWPLSCPAAACFAGCFCVPRRQSPGREHR
ncbi:hypothetical protein D3C80_1225240 [compost metagenome]